MPGDHYSLREHLRQTAPDLAADLEYQWRIANAEWLPAVGMSLDSSNGIAHVCGVENHLNITLNALYGHDRSAGVFSMRPIETYLLLAAILFHDIGRIKKDAKDHGDATREYLRDSYGSLGVRDREVANALGRICAYHSKDSSKDRQEYERINLNDVVIDPYGEVRQRMLAALLTLADMMDNAYTRAISSYLRGENEKDLKGRFRSIVLGVLADPSARCVKTVLVSRPKEAGFEKDEPIDWFSLEEGSEGKQKRDRQIDGMTCFKDKESLKKALDDLVILQERAASRTLRHIRGMTPSRGGKKGLRELKQLVKYQRTTAPHALTRKQIQVSTGKILDGFCRSDCQAADLLLCWNILGLRVQRGEPASWRSLASMILGDIRKNREVLHSIRDHLATVGLSLATWLMECDERLYTPAWSETFEPLFTRDYLDRVVEAMWDMSRRIFGAAEFSYPELAAYIGDSDLHKIRLAVRRLSILTNAHSGGAQSPIWAGDAAWRWRTKPRIPGKSGCEIVALSSIQNDINNNQLFSEPYTADEVVEV